MITVYPVIFERTPDGIYVDIPDFNIGSQGADMAEAIYMARDAIGLAGITLQDKGCELPQPSDLSVIDCPTGAVVSLVDVDIDAYRRAHDNRTVRRNVTLPAWLDERANQSGINVSACLQEALKEKLKVE